MMEPYDDKLIAAYYTVADSLRSTAANMAAQAECLAQIADRMSEDRARLKQPDSAGGDRG